MLTVIDLDEAQIEAEAQAQQWEQDFQRAFNAPMLRMQAVMSLLALPDEMRSIVRGPLAEQGQQRVEKMRRMYG
jgi:hypothetical protein